MGPTALSWLEQELCEQGEVLAARAAQGWQSARAAADALRSDDVDYLVIAARGTSDNAARYAQYLLGVQSRIPVALAAPWLYSGDSPPLLARGAVVAISQSGRSPDIAAVVAAARDQRRPTVVITNDLDSPLAAAADVVVPLLAGVERSVAATKTYLASLHAIAQITACVAGTEDAWGAWFEHLPSLVSATVSDQLAERGRFDPLNQMGLVTALGRGLQFPTAFETALKIRELSGIPAEAFSPPELVHGPIAALGPSGAVWLVSTTGRGRPDRAAFELLRHGSGLSVVVSDDDELLAAADIGVRVGGVRVGGVGVGPGLAEWVAPMIAVIPGQVAALRLGELRGVDLDRPHGLRKVTLTS